MKLFELYATLGLDTSGFDKGVEKAKKSTNGLAQTISAKTVAAGVILGKAAEKAIGGIVRIAKESVQSAAEVAAENAQFEAAFKTLGDTAQKTYAAIGKEANILTSRLKATGTKGFSQFKGAGLEANEALDASSRLLRLAADGAAYYDISLEAADERLRSFIRGNTEAGDAIGLFTSESQRNARAMEMYKKKYVNLTEAQKQLLMLNVAEEIYRQSGATGQAAREGHEYANVMSNLSEAYRQLQAAFGEPVKEGLLPGIEALTGFMQQSNVKQLFTDLGTSIGAFSTDALTTLSHALNWYIQNKDTANTALSVVGGGLGILAAKAHPVAAVVLAASTAIVELVAQMDRINSDAAEFNSGLLDSAQKKFEELGYSAEEAKIKADELQKKLNETNAWQPSYAVAGAIDAILGTDLVSEFQKGDKRAAENVAGRAVYEARLEKYGATNEDLNLMLASGEFEQYERYSEALAKVKETADSAAESIGELQKTITLKSDGESSISQLKEEILSLDQAMSAMRPFGEIVNEKERYLSVLSDYSYSVEQIKAAFADTEMPSTFWDAVSAGAETAKSSIDHALSSLNQFLANDGKSVNLSASVSWNYKKIAEEKGDLFSYNLGLASGDFTPQHATGLDYVPMNNYVARLHRGEMVLTAQEAEDYRAQRKDRRIGEEGVTVIQNIRAVPMTPRELAFQTANALESLRFGL